MFLRTTVAVLTAASTVLLSACAVDIPASKRTRPLIAPERSAVGLHGPRPPTILRLGSADTEALSRPVSVNMAGVSLVTLFNAAAPDMTLVPTDGGVDLRKEVAVQIQDGTLRGLLEQLTVAANYAFEVDGDKIELSSVMTEQWNLAAFSAARKSYGSVGNGKPTTAGQGGASAGVGADRAGGTSTVSAGGGAPSSSASGATTRGVVTKLSYNEDEWVAVINSARAMLGIAQVEGSADSGGGSGSGGFGNNPAATAAGVSEGGGATLTSIRSLGLIRATGSPRQITRLDAWLSTLAEKSTKQIHLDVKTMEVTLNDSRARGINWQALISGSINGFDLNGLIGFSGPIDRSVFPSTPGSFTGSIEGIDSDGNPQFEAVLNFLSQYGSVRLVNEPNVTVTNGRTANITTGREFSYVATVTQTVVEGGTVITTPSVARVLVGVKLAVTPRILPDKRILVNVVPVITSLQGFSEFRVSGTTITNPNIALQALATQVITRPGVPIHIGGLISSKLAGTLNSLPVQDSWWPSPLEWVFSSEQNTMERRELVIMITPNLVET